VKNNRILTGSTVDNFLNLDFWDYLDALDFFRNLDFVDYWMLWITGCFGFLLATWIFWRLLDALDFVRNLDFGD
jgi:hypothetical protein